MVTGKHIALAIISILLMVGIFFTCKLIVPKTVAKITGVQQAEPKLVQVNEIHVLNENE